VARIVSAGPSACKVHRLVATQRTLVRELASAPRQHIVDGDEHGPSRARSSPAE
jgi:hypothetical protein